jgi:hypothetical protein
MRWIAADSAALPTRPPGGMLDSEIDPGSCPCIGLSLHRAVIAVLQPHGDHLARWLPLASVHMPIRDT